MQCQKCDASMGAVASGVICRDCVSTPRPMAVSFFRHDLGIPESMVAKVRRSALDMIQSRTIPGRRLISITPTRDIIMHLDVDGEGDTRRSRVTITIGTGDHVAVACTTNILMQGRPQ